MATQTQNTRTVLLFQKLPAFHDAIFALFVMAVAGSPIFLMVLYFETLQSIGFQFTLFLYVIILCSAVLIAYGISHIFLLINAYRQRERIFLDSIGDGVCGIDPDGRIILWNTAAEIISGYKKKDVLHASLKSILSLGHTRGKTKEREFMERILASTHAMLLPVHTVLKTKDGRAVPLGATSAPVSDRKGAIRGAIIVFRDATREQQISRAKDELVSLVSHQLRTPLTNMNWRLEMLLDGEVGKLTDEQKKYLGEIERGTSRMTELVNIFLNVSRIHLGTLAITLQQCNLRTLISAALEEYTPQIAQKKLTVKKSIGKTIGTFSCDPRVFHAVLQNLISNAVEYTPDRGAITLRATKESGAITISVADTGIGIPKKNQSKIFTKLFRAENVRQSHPDGNGLGLYLIKSLIDESGGQIWFESEEGKGATFFISFPSTGMRAKKGARAITLSK